jgi:GNAT superfamily N-acetyltransferase
MQQTSSTVDIRSYRPEDEPAVLDLLRASLGPGPTGDRSVGFFRWKHTQNPFGPSYMLVAEVDNRIVGLRAFMRWRFRAGCGSISAVRAVDTATHPEFQGLGIFSRLTRTALEELRGKVDLVFNTPNEKSGPGYVKMGWQVVGRIPVRIRIRRPIRFARGLPYVKSETSTITEVVPDVDALRVADVLDDTDAVDKLLKEAPGNPARLTTDRSLEYLKWRYASAPFDYRAVAEEVQGTLGGMAVFRVRPRGRLLESTVTDVIAPENGRSEGGLLKEVVRSASTDYVAYRFPAEHRTTRWGWLRAPGGISLMVNRLQKISPDPIDPRSWALTLGDLEVF